MAITLTTTYRPLLESTSVLGIVYEIERYKRIHKTATFVDGQLERIDGVGYMMSAEFEDPNAW